MERALRDSEARARDAEARLRQAIESVSDGFALWDADDRLVLANQRYRALYPALEGCIRPGVGFAELARRLAWSGCLPEAVGREDAWVAERLERKRVRDGEAFERQLADGRWLRVADYRTAEDGLVTLHSDITELKRQAEELRAQEAELRGIIDNIPGVVYRRVRHPDGRISYPYHSPQIERRHGFDAQAVANDPQLLRDAVHPDDRARWLAAIEESAERLAPFAGDFRILLREGEFHWFRTLATPRREDDGSIVWTGVSIDVTELKTTEQALRDSEERYRRLVEAGPIALLTLRDGWCRSRTPGRSSCSACRPPPTWSGGRLPPWCRRRISGSRWPRPRTRCCRTRTARSRSCARMAGPSRSRRSRCRPASVARRRPSSCCSTSPSASGSSSGCGTWRITTR